MRFDIQVITVILVLLNTNLYAQIGVDSVLNNVQEMQEVSQIPNDSIFLNAEDSGLIVDSNKLDSIKHALPKPYKISSDSMEAPVLYEARDSFIFEVDSEIVHLYGAAIVKYKEITLEAEYIKLNWKTNEVYAEGRKDTSGNLYGTPVFHDEDKNYKSERMRYNYRSKKGKIWKLITQDGDGFIHGTEVKKFPNDEMFAKNAKYTTCNLEVPHFEIALSILMQ